MIMFLIIAIVWAGLGSIALWSKEPFVGLELDTTRVLGAILIIASILLAAIISGANKADGE